MPSSAEGNSGKSDRSVLQGVRVLVVEDAWCVAKALKLALEQLGMRVSGPAATTEQARRLLTDEKPDMAVVDINLGREQAFGLIEELHEQGALDAEEFKEAKKAVLSQARDSDATPG